MSVPINDHKNYRYLALGDSYTIGESVTPAERWPVQLVKALRDEGITVADPEIIAQTGWTTSELLDALVKKNLTGPYQLVTLLIGVNNQYRGYSEENYQRDLKDLLTQAVTLAGGDPGKVVVVTIPDWGVMPYAEGRNRLKIRQEIDLFNSILVDQAADAGVVVVDVTRISREADQRTDLVALDGLHPSAVQYAEWVKIILPEARSIFD